MTQLIMKILTFQYHHLKNEGKIHHESLIYYKQIQIYYFPSRNKYGSLIWENWIVLLQTLNKCIQAIVPNWDKHVLKINACILKT